jgi:hypothetical protein
MSSNKLPPFSRSSLSSLVERTNIDDGRERAPFSAQGGDRLDLDVEPLVEASRLGRQDDRETEYLRFVFSGEGIGAVD